MTPCEKAENGTKIVLTIKDNTESENYDEFLEPYRVQGLVKKYSDYIRYPIKMDMTRSRMKEKPADAGDDYKPEWKSIPKHNPELHDPDLEESKKELKDEDYNNFYTQKFFDYQPPLCHIHTSVEGAVTYTAMLFIPSHAPMDYYTKDYEKGLQLYSNGVLIMDKCEELLPDYFASCAAWLTHPTSPLNISPRDAAAQRPAARHRPPAREEDQADLVNMRDDDREAYEKFFEQFGRTFEVRYLPELRDGQGHARRPASVLLRQAAEDDHSGRVFGRGSRWRRFHLLCRGDSLERWPPCRS